MSEPVVVVDGLGRRFDAVMAVEDLTFSVGPGELLGVVGPDGAGKTTTLRMLAGVLRPSNGRARLFGVDVAARPEDAKRHLAYMAQRFGLYEDLTVQENLDFYADLYGVPRNARAERLDRLFSFSGLGPFRDRLAGHLSGGMKQKLSLSCCLVHRPRLLLLDEPTFGVDPISRRELWLIVHEMVGAGVAAIVTTSYMDEAERCDRVLMLSAGRTVALDRPEALQASLDGTLLELRTSEPRKARDALRGARGVRRASLFGDAVHVLLSRDPAQGEDLAGRLRDALAAHGVELEEAHPIEASLEDVFMDRVAGPDAAGAAAGAAAGTATHG